MNRRAMLMGLIAMTPLPTGCATVFGRTESPSQRDLKRIKWGFVILDLLWLGTVVVAPLGLVFLLVDFASGAIYKKKTYEPMPDIDELDLEQLEDPVDDPSGYGMELDVEGPFSLCSEATALVIDGGADQLEPWTLWLADHAASCAECRRALTARGRPGRLHITTWVAAPRGHGS